MQDNTTDKNKTSVVCRVKKVIFHNKENGYSVLSAISDTEDGPFSLCGILNGTPEGTVLHCQGYWKDHIMYGRQFMVDSWEEGKADELEKLFSIPSRANSRPVYRTWGDFLKNNPDVAPQVKYTTEVFLTEVERDFDNVDYDYSLSCIEISATAHVKAVYYAVYNGQKYSLITCSFTTYGSIDVDDLNEGEIYDIEMHHAWEIVESHAQRSSAFFGIGDFDGLRSLDFHASGVPTCEDEMREKYYKDHPDALDDYTVDDMAFELESALETSLKNAGIEYEDCEYQCTRLFSRHKISGEIF